MLDVRAFCSDERTNKRSQSDVAQREATWTDIRAHGSDTSGRMYADGSMEIDARDRKKMRTLPLPTAAI